MHFSTIHNPKSSCSNGQNNIIYLLKSTYKSANMSCFEQNGTINNNLAQLEVHSAGILSFVLENIVRDLIPFENRN